MEILKASLNDVVRSVARWTALNQWPLADLGGNARAVAWGVGNCFIVALANGASTTEIDLRVRPYKGKDIYNPNPTACKMWNDLLAHCQDMSWISDFRRERYQAYQKLTVETWAENSPDAIMDQEQYIGWAIGVMSLWENAVPDASTREAAAKFFEWLEGTEDKALQPMIGVAPGDKDDVQPTASTERDEMVRFELVFKGTLNQFIATIKAIDFSGAIPPESMLHISEVIGVDEPEYYRDLVRFIFHLELAERRAYAEHGGYLEHGWQENGNILVQTLPDNNCRMIVKVKNEVWRKLAQPWRLFQVELARQGWIDTQPTATGAADTPQLLASAVLGDGQPGELITALLQRIYDHFVTHGEWPRYNDLEIEMHNVAPLYEIISGIDESLLLYEWPIQESSICFLTLKGIEKCNGSERDIQNFLRATDLFARRYIRDRATATISNHDLMSELGMSESEAHRACKLILRYGGILREGASSIGDGRWHEFRASRKALHFEGVSTLEDYFKRETRAWEAEKSEADRALRPLRAHSSHPTDHRAMLRQNLVDHFNREELRTLCFDLGIEHENLPDAKEGLARELVAHCQRRGIITDLVAKCRKLHPDVSWEGVYE